MTNYRYLTIFILLIFDCSLCFAQKLFTISGAYSVAELIVKWSFSIQKWYVCSSIRNWIAFANEANIVNKDSPIRQALGIHNFRERRTRFIWLTKQNQKILLHETHSTQGNEASWKREWGARLVGFHGANNATRVAILTRNNLNCKVEESIVDSNGKFILLQVLPCEKPALLCNICSPNRDNELVTIGKNYLNEIENIVVGADLNCPFHKNIFTFVW